MIDLDGGSIRAIAAWERTRIVTRRDTNTIVIKLEGEDEMFKLIEEIARNASEGGGICLVIEQDEITYLREIFED